VESGVVIRAQHNQPRSARCPILGHSPADGADTLAQAYDPLPKGPPSQAADIAFTRLSPDLFQLLVIEGGWRPAMWFGRAGRRVGHAGRGWPAAGDVLVHRRVTVTTRRWSTSSAAHGKRWLAEIG